MTFFTSINDWLHSWNTSQKNLFEAYTRIYSACFATETKKNIIRARDVSSNSGENSTPRDVSPNEFFLKSADFNDNPFIGRAVNVRKQHLEYVNWHLRIAKENDLTPYIEEIIGIIHASLYSGLEQANSRVDRIYRDYLNEPNALFLEEFVTWLTTSVASVDCNSSAELGCLGQELNARTIYLKKIKNMAFTELQRKAGQRDIISFYNLVKIIVANIEKINEYTKIAQSRITAAKQFEELSTNLNLNVKKTFEYLFYSGLNRTTSSNGFTFTALVSMESGELEAFVSRMLLHIAKTAMPNYLPRDLQAIVRAPLEVTPQRFNLRRLQIEIIAMFEWWPLDQNNAIAWGLLPQQATEEYKELYLNTVLSFIQLIATQKIVNIIARIAGHGGNIMTYGLAGQLLIVLIAKLENSLAQLQTNIEKLNTTNETIQSSYLGNARRHVPEWAYSFDTANVIFEQQTQHLTSCRNLMESIRQAIRNYKLVDEMNKLREEVHDLIECSTELMIIRGDSNTYIEQWKMLGNELVNAIPLVQQIEVLQIETPGNPQIPEQIQNERERDQKENLALVKQINPILLIPFATKHLRTERRTIGRWTEPGNPEGLGDMMHLKFEEIILTRLTMDNLDTKVLLPALALRKRRLKDYEGAAGEYLKILNNTPAPNVEILIGYAKSLSNIISNCLGAGDIKNLGNFNSYLMKYIEITGRLHATKNLTQSQQEQVRQLEYNLGVFKNGFPQYVTVGEQLKSFPVPPTAQPSSRPFFA